MTNTIPIPETFTAKVRGQDFAVEPRALPEVALARIFEYGLQRMFNDAAAGAKDGDEALALAGKKLASLLDGKLRAASTREGDPIKREAKRIATEVVTAKCKGKGRKPKDVENFAELVADYAARPTTIAQAELNVAAMANLDIDIEI